MSETPPTCIVGEVEPGRAAAVIRAALVRVGLSTIAADDGPMPGLPAAELSWVGSCTTLGGTGELTVHVHGPPATAAAVFAAMSAETGGFVVSDSVGAWYAGHPVAFDPSARGSSLADLVPRLSGDSDLRQPHAITTERTTWALLGTPTIRRAPGPFACAVFPLADAHAFARAWAREPAAAAAGWAWAALRAPPLDVDCRFVMLRRQGRADPELVDRLARSLGPVPAATFELVDGRGTAWWLSPSHPRLTEPLDDITALIDLLGNAALLMGSWAAAMAWPMD